MRGTIPGLVSPHPLGRYLPGIYQENPFATESTILLTTEEPFAIRFTQALDEVLAPVLLSLDNVEAHLDPMLAPEDFLDWLASWVAVQADETWPVERRRAMVASAVDLFRERGTVAGLRRHLEIVTGGEVEIVENGGTAWSDVVNATMPGTSQFSLLVRVKVKDPKSVSVTRLDKLVGEAKPAHVPHKVEVAAA